MDAHLFRILSGLLAGALTGARLERIHEPLPGVFSFTLFAEGEKKRLLFKPGRSASLLFLTTSPALPNPPFPSALVMRLRKYAEGRRLGPLREDWSRRRLAFSLPGPLPGEPDRQVWLLVDMKEGPSILFALPEDFGAPVPWPGPEALSEFPHAPDDAGPLAAWRNYPPLTPQLRKTLTALEPEDGLALIRDLEAGEDDIFLYQRRDGAVRLSAWPLPPALLADSNSPFFGFAETAAPPDALSRLEAFREVQEPYLLGEAETRNSDGMARDRKKARKRNDALRKRLEAEKTRLLAVLDRREDAKLLQANLWRHPPDFKTAEIRLDDPATPGRSVRIALDPKRTLKENMEELFHQSDRAKRGLLHLSPRLEALASGKKDPLARPALPPPAGGKGPGQGRAGGKHPAAVTWAEFVSSDGFLMLRGKNARGNLDILRGAKPHDFWFHSEDGPSAHLVLKRHHAGHTVPERTLREAASLVALKSDGKNDDTVRVICALVKDVTPVKGGRPGTVSVHAILHSLKAAPDPTLEESLRGTM